MADIDSLGITYNTTAKATPSDESSTFAMTDGSAVHSPSCYASYALVSEDIRGVLASIDGTIIGCDSHNATYTITILIIIPPNVAPVLAISDITVGGCSHDSTKGFARRIV